MPVDGNAKTPKASASGDVNASNINENAGVSGGAQSGEGDSRSATDAPLPGNEDRPASAEAPRPAANGPSPRRFRGRRRIRSRAQLMARYDDLANKLERGLIDPKVAAIQVQCWNGWLACFNAEKDQDFEKRLVAVEEKTSTDKPRKRGGDA